MSPAFLILKLKINLFIHLYICACNHLRSCSKFIYTTVFHSRLYSFHYSQRWQWSAELFSQKKSRGKTFVLKMTRELPVCHIFNALHSVTTRWEFCFSFLLVLHCSLHFGKCMSDWDVAGFISDLWMVACKRTVFATILWNSCSKEALDRPINQPTVSNRLILAT